MQNNNLICFILRVDDIYLKQREEKWMFNNIRINNTTIINEQYITRTNEPKKQNIDFVDKYRESGSSGTSKLFDSTY